MKRLLFLLALLPLLLGRGFSQNADSLAVDSLVQVSRTLTKQRDFDKALEAIAIAEKIALEKWGRESAGFGSCCFYRGLVHHKKGDQIEAEKWYLESKSIRQKALGREHPDYAGCLVHLAILYKDMGNYGKAEPLLLEAKEIFEVQLNNKEHPFYSNCLFNLASLYRETGHYEKAEPLYLEANAIWEKVFGKEHPNLAIGLLGLGALYHVLGNYEKAELLYLEANTIREKAFGKEHNNYAQTLNNLGVLYMDMSNYDKANAIFFEATAIREKTLGKEHPEYAQSLNNLAILYVKMGNYEKAELLFCQAKVINEKAVGKDHLYYVETLNNLAVTYTNMRNYEKAEQINLEAKAIFEKTLGTEHPDYSRHLYNLACLYRDMGNYEKAEPLHLEAKAILEKVLGKEHPDYALSLDRLANLYEKQSRYSASEPLLIELSALEQTRFLQASSFLSERELANYTATLQASGENLGAYHLARPPKNQTGTLPALAFNHALFQKGFLLTAAARLNVLAAASPKTEEINARLKAYRRRLAAEYSGPIAERKDVAELEEKATAAEKELARASVGYAEAIRRVGWQEVRAALGADEAGIEFVRFRVEPSEKAALPGDSTMYAALLLSPGAGGPKFIPLFEEKSLDSLLRRNSEFTEIFLRQLYAPAARGEKTVGSPQKTLYQMVWQPLETALAGAKTVYFSPAGLLHRINLAAVSPGGGETLGERRQLVQLSSTRQLTAPDFGPDASGSNFRNPGASGEALLFGGIRYQMDSSAIAAANLGLENSEVVSRRNLGFAQTDSSSRGGNWAYLPWTEKEISALEPILAAGALKTAIRKGFAATEEAFKTIGKTGPSPRVLHLATHGFFFPDRKRIPMHREAFKKTPVPRPRDKDQIFKISEHPMIRSGLLLAGANHAWKTGKPLKPGMDDGILTAYEISQMNLSSTELVVLSACETALGDIAGNEGVYGLQRAFKIAGAKYLLMSLWQVPDRETAEFMTAFYQNWLEGKMAIPDAFRAAQKEMRTRFSNPYLWAGFVLVE